MPEKLLMNQESMHPHIAVIGRPNVGKSTLFNRLLGRRKALVHQDPGTTRDRNEALISWKGKEFILVDTGGWAHDVSIFSSPVRKQMEQAMAGSDLVLLVVDGQNGFHPLDAELAQLARKDAKEVIVVVNKIDSGKEETKIADFYRLGIPEMVSISADHGRNIFELMDMIDERVAKQPAPATEQPATAIKLILVGKPNVGKSSLLNTLAHKDRSIVHNLPGTTREAIDTSIDHEGQSYVLIDTPGLHRKRKFTNDMDYLMSLSAHHAMERADVAIIVMDIEQGIGETEMKIAEMALENRKACLLVINKWDLVEGREEAVKSIRQQLEEKLKFLWWTKVLYISAKTGQRVERILTEAHAIYQEFCRTVPDDELKDVIRRAETRKPFSRHGEPLRIRDVAQTGICPPVFTFFVNDPTIVHFSYRRYLENALRERFDFTGTPLLLKFIRAVKAKKITYET